MHWAVRWEVELGTRRSGRHWEKYWGSCTGAGPLGKHWTGTTGRH
jgi:hypothetical protein